MNAWLSFGGAVCMAAAGCTLLHMLVGKKGAGRLLRMITAAFFLCAVPYPLSGMKKALSSLPEISAETADTAALYDLSLRQLREKTEEIVLQSVNTALKNHGLEAQKVVIGMDTSADGSISINSVSLLVSDENALHRVWIQQIAEKHLGMEVEVLPIGRNAE